MCRGAAFADSRAMNASMNYLASAVAVVCLALAALLPHAGV
jgi:hypothetical protein